MVEACLNSAENSTRRWNRLNLREEFDPLQREGIIRGEAVEDLRASGFHDGYLRTLPRTSSLRRILCRADRTQLARFAIATNHG